MFDGDDQIEPLVLVQRLEPLNDDVDVARDDRQHRRRGNPDAPNGQTARRRTAGAAARAAAPTRSPKRLPVLRQVRSPGLIQIRAATRACTACRIEHAYVRTRGAGAHEDSGRTRSPAARLMRRGRAASGNRPARTAGASAPDRSRGLPACPRNRAQDRRMATRRTALGWMSCLAFMASSARSMAKSIQIAVSDASPRSRKIVDLIASARRPDPERPCMRALPTTSVRSSR